MKQSDIVHVDRPYCLVGITGGFGSGKSALATIIAETQAVLHSDSVAQELMEQDAGIRSELKAVFGEHVFAADGSIDRRALARRVFGSPEQLAALNAIVHPRTVREIEHRADALARQGRTVIFVESALIFEAGIDDAFDYIIAVVAADDVVAARLAARGYSAEDLHARMRHQLPPAEKQSRADFTIHNDGGFDELRRNASFILSIISSLCSNR